MIVGFNFQDLSHAPIVTMNELDQLRAEAEQLKNAIRVRTSVSFRSSISFSKFCDYYKQT